MSEVLLVLTTFAEEAAAHRAAEAVVGQRLAACASVQAACTSWYWWEDAVQQDREYLLLIKTSAARYSALEAALRSLHTYQVPEIIAIPVRCGLPAYLDWLRQQTAEPESGSRWC